MLRIKNCVILILPVLIACSPELTVNSNSQSPSLHVIKTLPNQKYKLEAIFSGIDVDVGDRKVPVIQQVSIRSSETGQELQYSRPDGPSTSDANAYFTDVWSADGELLLLPLDRFHGFCINRADEALAAMQKQSCRDTIRVRADVGTSLWHQFEKWETVQSFIFSAGLSGDQIKVRYEIGQERLTVLEPNVRFLVGENSKGKIKVMPLP